MSKTGIYRISGNTSPVVGKETVYHIEEWYPNTPLLERNPMNVTWELFIRRKNGQFASTNIKKKGISHFTFGEKAWRYIYRLEAYLNTPEGKEPMSLIIKPQPSKIPQINKVELHYVDDAQGTVFSFHEKLRAKAHCVNLSNEELLFTLWEDDAKGPWHNSKNLLVETAKGKVNPRNGIAVAEFMLTKGLMTKAMRGEHDGQLEFYVTAEYYKNKTHDSENVNVNNPLYKKPQEGTNTHKPKNVNEPPKAKNSPAAEKPKSKKEEKGIWENIWSKGKELWDVAESKIATATKDKEPAKKVDNTNKPVVVDVADRENKNSNGCPNCDKDITLQEIKAICVSPKNKKGVESCLIEDEKFLVAALPILNKFRDKVGINTCLKKAHFLAQISQESKFYQLQERFKYSDPNRLLSLFPSYFNQFGKNKIVEAQRLSKLSMDKKNWEEVANSIYGIKHPLGKHNTDKNDGWRYSGKGFKQITWKDNYINLQKYVVKNFGIDVNWVGNNNPYKLRDNPMDAMISALAFWGRENINSVAIGIENEDVTAVTKKINTRKEGLKERIRFFNKALEVLNVNQCIGKKKRKSNSNEKGTVVLVSGDDTKLEKDPTLQNLSWVTYKTTVFHDITLESFYKLEKLDKLPDPDYITYLTRDTHQFTNRKKTEIYKHSEKRYGQYNEIPPGEYFVVPGLEGQKYTMYIIDSESKSASSEDGINGIDGDRGGVAIHQYCPRFSVGCFTLNSGKNKEPVIELKEQLKYLKIGDKIPTYFILRPRKVKESIWEDIRYGTKKWTGIK